MKTSLDMRAGPGQTAEGGPQRKADPAKLKVSRCATLNNVFQRRITGKTTPPEHADAVTTREALDGHREKTMRVASVENNTLSWVSRPPARLLDVTQSSEAAHPMSSLGPTTRTGDAGRRTEIRWNSCVSCTKHRRCAAATSHMSRHQQ